MAELFTPSTLFTRAELAYMLDFDAHGAKLDEKQRMLKIEKDLYRDVPDLRKACKDAKLA